MDNIDKITAEITLAAQMMLFTRLVRGMPSQLVSKYHPLLTDILDMYRKRGEALDVLKPGDFDNIERKAKEKVMNEGKSIAPERALIAKNWDGKTLPFYSVGNSGAVWEVFATSDKEAGKMIKRPSIVSSEYYKGRCVDPNFGNKKIGDIEDLHWSLFRGDNVKFTLEEAHELASDGTLHKDYVFRDLSA